MGILDFTSAPAAASARRQPFAGVTHPNGDKPKSKVWLNVGYQAGDKFVNLPLGLGVDTMDPAEVRGQNQDFVNLRHAQNGLLKMLQDKGASMAPGQEVTVQLEVRLRRVNEEMMPSIESNELAIEPAVLFREAAE